MKNTYSICCIECNNLQISEKYREEFQEKISKETLMQLVRTTSFDEVGRNYKVNGNTIRKCLYLICSSHCSIEF